MRFPNGDVFVWDTHRANSEKFRELLLSSLREHLLSVLCYNHSGMSFRFLVCQVAWSV